MSKPAIQPDKKTDVWRIDSRKLIIEEGLNRREDYGDMEELVASIKANGVLSPLHCYRDGENYKVIRGHRRKRALDILWERYGEIIIVPTTIEQKHYPKEKRILDQISENTGKPFTPWEQAKVFRDLQNYGWKESEMAERSGISEVYIRRLLSLANAPQKLINLVREKRTDHPRISATFAMDTIAQGLEAIELVLQKAESGELNGHVSEQELFPQGEGRVGRVARITQSDIKPNSVKMLKTFIKEYDKEEEKKEMSEEKAEFFKWVRKLLAGELTEKDIKRFFR